MPRDSNGNYTLPAGNPVVSGTTIDTGWANPTLSDVANELTNSLDRNGRGAMLAPFKFLDGTSGLPGITWTNEPSTGFYRAGASDMRVSVAGVPLIRWTGTGVAVWDLATSTWVSLTTPTGLNVAILNQPNAFTVEQTLSNISPSLRWTETDAGADRKHWRWVAEGGIMFFQLRNDANDASSIAFRIASATTFGVQSINVGNTVSVTTLNLQAPNINAGLGTYIPATAGSTSWLGMTQAAAATGAAVIGVYHPDGVKSPRAELFANGNDASVGLNWTYASGVVAFDFRRAGSTIFRYTDTGVSILNGLGMYVYATGNAKAIVLSHNGADGIIGVGSGAGRVAIGATNGGPIVTGSEGRILHNNESFYVYGGVQISQSDPSGTDAARGGEIWLKIV